MHQDIKQLIVVLWQKLSWPKHEKTVRNQLRKTQQKGWDLRPRWHLPERFRTFYTGGTGEVGTAFFSLDTLAGAARAACSFDGTETEQRLGDTEGNYAQYSFIDFHCCTLVNIFVNSFIITLVWPGVLPKTKQKNPPGWEGTNVRLDLVMAHPPECGIRDNWLCQ